ncbi:DinB family protein [Hyphobacterium sp. CCMP332]|nr:DinB family protein [Hyphobacterium sp. CCMP332]
MEIQLYFSELEKNWEEVNSILKKWQQLDAHLLKKKPSAEKWSALECIDHLNQTYQVYIPNLNKALNDVPKNPQKKYKAGLFGDIMVSSVGLKSNGKAKMPMKTFDFFEPGKLDNLNKEEVFDRFFEFHEKLRGFIQNSKDLDINKIKVQSALSWLKLRLGVCFLFLLNHELRHIAQAKRAMNNS